MVSEKHWVNTVKLRVHRASVVKISNPIDRTQHYPDSGLLERLLIFAFLWNNC